MRTVHTRALAGVLAAALVAVSAGTDDADGIPAVRGAVHSATTSSARNWEHRYRVSGKVRLLFWVGRDDVGTARLTRRSAGSATTISFIGGSDPRRAPGNMNHWGLAIEDFDEGSANVFVVRSIGPRDVTAPELRMAEGTDEAVFGAVCATVDHGMSRASVTGIRVPPTVTFRGVRRLIDALSTSRTWESSCLPQPGDGYPGFFSAVLAGMDESLAGARPGISSPGRARSYLFNGTVYDISFGRVEPAGPARLRQRFHYRNQKTGQGDDFTVTFGTDGDLAGVPVEMTFQPSWWLKVHLRLDDKADVPTDPSQDPELSTRINGLCASVLSTVSARPR